MTDTTPKPIADAFTACSIIEGFGDETNPSEERQREAWQYLIDTGIVWSLQGWYGRNARDLIDNGACHAAKV